jgi:hypothetical protein
LLQRPPHAHLHPGLTPQQQPLGLPLQVHLTHQSAVTRHGCGGTVMQARSTLHSMNYDARGH